MAVSSRSPRVISSVDLSATALAYGDTLRSNGASLSPSFRADWSRATLGGAASVTRLSQGGVSVQASVAPSIFTPSAGAFTAEVAGAFGGSSHSDGTRTGQALGTARIYMIGAERGAWLGGGAGRMWDGVVWRGVRQGELGGWFTGASTTTLVSITPVVVADTIRYADTQAALRYPTGAFELGLTAGVRSGAATTAIGGSSRAWGSVSVLAWLSRQMAVVGSAGSYPVDLTEGYPGGRYLSVALRIASGNTRAVEREDSSPATTSKPAPAATAPDASRAPALVVRTPTAGSARREIRIFAPAAKSVEVNGDFTQWQPVRLTHGADGWWTATRTLARGTYQMNIRVDGGAWIAPSGLLTTRDEFGGVTGILTIE